jgi:hypothetical protein
MASLLLQNTVYSMLCAHLLSHLGRKERANANQILVVPTALAASFGLSRVQHTHYWCAPPPNAFVLRASVFPSCALLRKRMSKANTFMVI